MFVMVPKPLKHKAARKKKVILQPEPGNILKQIIALSHGPSPQEDIG